MSPAARPVALVTGAARGIGAATVAALAAARVARRSGGPVRRRHSFAVRARVARRAGSRGRGRLRSGQRAAGDTAVIAAQADTRDPDALASAVRLAEDRWGGLDAAVAAAGVIAGGVPAWQLPLEQQHAVLDINLGGVLTLARVAVPAMLRRPEPRRGRFLAVASAAATRGMPMLAAYGAAKAGVTGFVRALAVELGGTGVTANAVSPGSTATPHPGRERPPVRPARRPGLRRAAAHRAAAAPGRGGRGARVPGRRGRQRHDRRHRARRRRPGPVTPRAARPG